jgi:putative ABC transport system permease protein
MGLCLIATAFVKAHEALAGSFFGAGFFALAALLMVAWRWLKSQGKSGDPQPTLLRLAVRNAGRNPVRSILTVGLLAGATFMIIAVEAFHREPATDFFNKTGGSGGYRLLAQTEVPLFQNLDDSAVREELGMSSEMNATIARVESFRVQPGDDASCLNLYKALQPRVLGVPQSLVHSGRFAFASSLGANDQEKANPWLLLDAADNGGGIPAIIDANTARWGLGNIGAGDFLTVKNGAGEDVKLRIVALLSGSMFQSEILVSDAAFLKLFPTQQGTQFFLIECDAADESAVAEALTKSLAAEGVQVQPTFRRMEQYLAVENTYLSTFQALGGLGLLLGGVGLAIVLARAVWERRAELALLRALGFSRRQLRAMVLAENGLLLMIALAIGTAAAFVAIAPHLIGGQAHLLWGRIAMLLAGAAAVGMAAGTLAVVGSLKTPVMTALRRE